MRPVGLLNIMEKVEEQILEWELGQICEGVENGATPKCLPLGADCCRRWAESCSLRILLPQDASGRCGRPGHRPGPRAGRFGVSGSWPGDGGEEKNGDRPPHLLHTTFYDTAYDSSRARKTSLHLSPLKFRADNTTTKIPKCGTQIKICQ